jgi:hypothetical protein
VAPDGDAALGNGMLGARGRSESSALPRSALELGAVASDEDASLFLLAGTARIFAQRRRDAAATRTPAAARHPRAAVTGFSDGAEETAQTNRLATRETRSVVALHAPPPLFIFGRWLRFDFGGIDGGHFRRGGVATPSARPSDHAARANDEERDQEASLHMSFGRRRRASRQRAPRRSFALSGSVAA